MFGNGSGYRLQFVDRKSRIDSGIGEGSPKALEVFPELVRAVANRAGGVEHCVGDLETTVKD